MTLSYISDRNIAVVTAEGGQPRIGSRPAGLGTARERDRRQYRCRGEYLEEATWMASRGDSMRGGGRATRGRATTRSASLMPRDRPHGTPAAGTASVRRTRSATATPTPSPRSAPNWWCSPGRTESSTYSTPIARTWAAIWPTGPSRATPSPARSTTGAGAATAAATGIPYARRVPPLARTRAGRCWRRTGSCSSGTIPRVHNPASRSRASPRPSMTSGPTGPGTP